ncbi:MAG TPA: TcpE family conjugal transfer membrane protein [Solirubrobacterales bacterium]|jgi:hypothetical protein
MPEETPRKVVRSYHLVFRGRWRIYRIQNWRVPLPGGLELRSIGYWLACLLAVVVLGRTPVVSAAMATLPESLRLVALPLIGAWALSRWEVDGRSPHRALFGIVSWWLRPRAVAGLRRCPAVGSVLTPVDRVTMAPDLYGPKYPRGRIVGPARMLLRYPVQVSLEGVPLGAKRNRQERLATAKSWRLRPTGGPALHRGKTLEVPAGRVVIFDGIGDAR